MSRALQSRTNVGNLQSKQPNVSMINSQDAAGLEEEMIIYRSQMQPSKWKKYEESNFPRLEMLISQFFSPFTYKLLHFVQTSVIITFLLLLESLRD